MTKRLVVPLCPLAPRLVVYAAPHSADLWFCIVARDPAPRIDQNRTVGASTIGAVRDTANVTNKAGWSGYQSM